MDGPILHASGLSVRFGGVRALVDVDLEARPAQLVGLIGPNGAGKTTFIDAITGFVSSSGTVQLDGRDLTSLAPHARARLGLARTWQSIELFDDLSVLENLSVASRRASALTTLKELFTIPREDDDAASRAMLERLGVSGLADAMPSELTQGQRKLVGVARALAADPRLLCLDEPAAGLDTSESAALGRQLRSIVDGGTSTLLVDHDMGLVLSVCDYVYVLEFGRLIAQGSPAEVRKDPTVIEAYLGSAATEVTGSDLAAAAKGELAR